MNYALASGDDGKVLYSEGLKWTEADVHATDIGGYQAVVKVGSKYYISDSADNDLFVTTDFTQANSAKLSVVTTLATTGEAIAFGDYAIFSETLGALAVVDALAVVQDADPDTIIELNAAADSGDGQCGNDFDLDVLAVVPATDSILLAASTEAPVQKNVLYLAASSFADDTPMLADNAALQATALKKTYSIAVTASKIVRHEGTAVGTANQFATADWAADGTINNRADLTVNDVSSAAIDANVVQVFTPDYTDGTYGESFIVLTTTKVFRKDSSGDDCVDLACPLAANLTKIWGSAWNNMFVTDNGGIIYRYDGTNWSKITNGDVLSTNPVTSGVAYSTSGAAATVGTSNKLGFTSGYAFSEQSVTVPPNAEFKDVVAATSDKLVAVGSEGLVFSTTDGENWTAIDGGAVVGSNNLRGIDATGADYFYAVSGQNAYEYNAGTWTDKGGVADSWFEKVALTSDGNGFIVGKNIAAGAVAGTDQAKLVKITNGVLSNVDLSTSGTSDETYKYRLRDIHALSASSIYICGDGGRVAKLNDAGDAWVDIELGTTATNLYAIFAKSASEIYVAGTSGKAWKYNGSAWTSMDVGVATTITDIWGYDDVLYAAASDGKVYKHDGSSWTAETTNNANELLGITGAQEGIKKIVAVGASSTNLNEDIGTSSAEAFPGQTGVAVTDSGTATVTDSSLQSEYKIPTTLEVITGIPSYNFSGTVNGKDAVGIFGFTYTPTVSTDTVGDLTLKKLIAGNNLPFTFSSTAVNDKGGYFWMTTAADVNTPLASTTTLTAGTSYKFWFTIQDGTDYDLNTADGVVRDPVVPLRSTSSSGGSSSGCVFNPAQTFGLEWLMLAFAPVAAFFRSRFKK